MKDLLNERLLAIAARLYTLRSDERAQTLAEYGLIVTVVAVSVVVLSVTLFRVQLIAVFDSATDCLNNSC